MEEEYRLWMGKYRVTRNGDIYSPDGRKLKATKNPGGYLCVTPYVDGIRYNKRVHRMVAELWIPNPDNHPMINHINGDKTDNRVENLEWCSASHNQKHAWDNGLRHSSTARDIVFCETGQVFPSAQKCVDQMGWRNLASSITCCCRRNAKSKTKRLKIKGYTVRYYQPTPLVEKLLKCGYDKYPESFEGDTYFIYLIFAQRWLRDVKGIHISLNPYGITPDRYDGDNYFWSFELYQVPTGGWLKVNGGEFESYELALSAGLDKALELLGKEVKE